MPKNIVIYSDGTGQDGGVRPDQRLTNVYKMYRASRIGPDSAIDPTQQVAFYDAGLGTDDDVHGFGRIWRTIGKFLGSVAGRGIGVNIADCYEFIINHWRPGDRIYIVGFSRGAYTARCVAQVLSLCGAPTHSAGDPTTPFRRFARSTRLAAERAVHQVYEHGAGHPIKDFEAERDEQARRFRVDYGSDVEGIANAYPYFIGVFDTVAALGAKGWKYVGLVSLFAGGAVVLIALLAGVLDWVFRLNFLITFGVLAIGSGLAVWLNAWRGAVRYIDDFPEKGAPRRLHMVRWRAENYDRGLSGHVGFARQASAIDEDRADFPRVAWGRHDVIRKPVEGEPPPLVQLWFAGNHSDIGGSYPEPESRLSDIALDWMVNEANSLPHRLLITDELLHTWPDHAAMQHSEVIAVRDQKLWWMPRWVPAWLRDGWQAAVRTASGSPLHPSVIARFAEPEVLQATGSAPYRPASLVGDDRFQHYYEGGDPETPDILASASTASYRVLGEEPIDFKIGSDGVLITKVLDRGGATTGAMVFVGPWSDEDRDDYRDGLALRYLDTLVRAQGMTGVPVERRSAANPLFARWGLLVLGADECAGRELARRSGQPVFVHLDNSGAVLLSAFALA
jgi:hypothetical protein